LLATQENESKMFNKALQIYCNSYDVKI